MNVRLEEGDTRIRYLKYDVSQTINLIECRSMSALPKRRIIRRLKTW